MGKWVITLCNLNIGTSLHARGKRLQFPVNRRLGELHSQSGHDGQEKNFCSYQELNWSSIMPIII
jgi:hypothetical protein